MKVSDSLSDSKPLREFSCILLLRSKESMGKGNEKSNCNKNISRKIK